MKGRRGIEITAVRPGSPAEKVNITPGNRLIAINGHEVRDLIDVMFYGNEPRLKLLLETKQEGTTSTAEVRRDEGCDIGISLKHFRVRICKNKCVFCFVSQLPRGLRRSLYVKDEDYRMSFLYGNYITLTNLTDEDKRRIVEQRLSPLYISVHATDMRIRNEMMGNPQATDIMKEIRFLADSRIKMHTQVVLCPGYNDRKVLVKTISDLYHFYPYVESIAVVPVGLTMHQKKIMKPVEHEDAHDALQIIQRFQARFKKKYGEYIVFGSDELYIKAEIPFPPVEQYGDFPQIENGVGMVPRFLSQARKVKILQPAQGKRFVTFTGMSFYPYLLKFVERLRKAGSDVVVMPIENTFFGKSVTVAGLLTGRDVIKSLSGTVHSDDILLIPNVAMKEGQNVFLDDVSHKDIEDLLKVRSVVVESTPKGLFDAIAGHS